MSKINRLEIKQIRILQALLLEKNVSRVADQIGLTQQAVSDHLRKLRELFDDPLFIRKKNGLVATPMAESLGPKIDQALYAFDGLLQPEVFNPEDATATYVIAATDYAQQVVLPDLISKLRHAAPLLKLVVRDLDIDNLQDQVASSRVDLVLAVPDYIPKSYGKIYLFTEKHVCVASKKSAYAQQNLSMEDIAVIPQIIATPSQPNFRGSVSAWFQDAGFTPNVIISAPCFSVVPSYIEATDAISFLPSRAPLNDKLEILTLEDCPLEFDVIAAWHSRSDKDQLHNWVLEILKLQYSI
ncbi:MAG: LysR family transcriptional regulator [Pseudomonas marincola]